MNILSIGNSFSQDAHRYLHEIARKDKVLINTFNLYIGGCSLYAHYRNMLSKEAEYILEMNGDSTGFKVSLEKALLNRAWDVITLQQASLGSPNYKSYQPYLDRLTEYVRKCAPNAKIVLHQTWAYEDGSKRLTEEPGYEKASDMLCDIKEAYEKAAEKINADFIIPSGEVFEKMLESGFEKVHRDSFHASLGAGRYALGLIWYMMLTGNDIENNTFCDFDEEISDDMIRIVKACVKEIYSKYQK